MTKTKDYALQSAVNSTQQAIDNWMYKSHQEKNIQIVAQDYSAAKNSPAQLLVVEHLNKKKPLSALAHLMQGIYAKKNLHRRLRRPATVQCTTQYEYDYES